VRGGIPEVRGEVPEMGCRIVVVSRGK